MNSAISMISRYDFRMDSECSKTLPNHPHVASYLLSRLKGRGILHTARLIIEKLSEITAPASDSEIIVQSLAIELDHERVSRLCAHLKMTDSSFHQSYSEVALGLYGRFVHDTDGNIEVILGPDFDRSEQEYFYRVFICAYAMLIGVNASWDDSHQTHHAA